MVSIVSRFTILNTSGRPMTSAIGVASDAMSRDFW